MQKYIEYKVATFFSIKSQLLTLRTEHSSETDNLKKKSCVFCILGYSPSFLGTFVWLNKKKNPTCLNSQNNNVDINNNVSIVYCFELIITT